MRSLRIIVTTFVGSFFLPKKMSRAGWGWARRAAQVSALSICILFINACSPPTVPDVTYYRLPPAQSPERAAKPISILPIEVETFRGEGIYAEQAVIYATTPDAGALRAYHYQLWSDPPSRGLQERLATRLRDSGIAPLVTDRLPASVQALHVQGRILHYERIQQGQGVIASVAFSMRVEQDSGEPLLEQEYSATQAAADDSMAATVRAFADAVDVTFAKFQADLTQLTGGAHGG